MLKDASTYEIMTPATVGLKKSSLPLGKLSGRNAFRTKLQEMGYYLNDDELNRVFGRFKDLADRKKTVYDEDLISLIETEVIYKSVPEHFRLEELVVLTGTTVKPNATVKMKIGDDLKTTSAFGDGPIDATYRAITRAGPVQVQAPQVCRVLHHRGDRSPGGSVGAPRGRGRRRHRPGRGPGRGHGQRPGLYQRPEPPQIHQGNWAGQMGLNPRRCESRIRASKQ